MPPEGRASGESPPHPSEQSEQILETSKGRVEIKCKVCGKTFETKKFHEDRRKFCSMSCRKADKQVREMTAIAKKAEETRLTPQQSSQIRGQIANYVTDQINLAHAVVTGAADWNPTQARVFGMLLNKVVPDLNASFHQHEHDVKQLTDLSRSELEAIAQGVETITVESFEDEAEQAGKMAYGNIIIEEEPKHDSNQ
mgnify:CR=1 FL=1|jgi:endogenous inhibitor of DNA gyrase (YacG/DUF329 family)